MKRSELITKITTYASRFVTEVEGLNANGLYDINIHSENFLIPLLNLIYELKLENLNTSQKKNYPAIDLADFNKGHAFQITATSDFIKIKNTIEKFIKEGLDKYFNSLYIYILTHKKDKYSQDKIDKIIFNKIKFNVNENIIDKDNLLQKINSITDIHKLEQVSKIFEQEFSDIKIECRKDAYKKQYLSNKPENLYPNMLTISFPSSFYSAELMINEQEITDRINEFQRSKNRRTYKRIRKEMLVKQILRENGEMCSDFVLHEGKLFTFKDLFNDKEALRILIDKGTISSIDSNYYADINTDTEKVFKHLLRQTLIELCRVKRIEWVGSKHIFRFANNSKTPDELKIRWKGKKLSTKTVIFKRINKKEGHTICFKSLAFRTAFEKLGEDWFLIINPTWSFTNPGGYKTSRFEPMYLAGIKKLERNQSIYNYFRFFGYYLSASDLFTKDYPYLKILTPLSFEIVPSLDDSKWGSIKETKIDIKGLSDELEEDTELNLSLFES